MSDTLFPSTIRVNMPGQYRQRLPAAAGHDHRRMSYPTHQSAPIQVSDTLAATLDHAALAALTDTAVLKAPEPQSGLWYRLNSTWPKFLPVTSRHHAESLLRQIQDHEPWVTIALQPDPGNITYFQVLGTPDRLTAEAGFCFEGADVSCRFTALPRNYRQAHVGPDWYRLTVCESDVLTIHDALGLLWPTLGGKFRRIGRIIPTWFT